MEKVVYGVEDQIDLALLEEQRLFGAMLQTAHLCEEVVLGVVHEIRYAPLLLVLSQDRGGVLGRVAQQALHLIRIPDSGDRDQFGHVRGAVYSWNLMMSLTVSEALIDTVASSRHP